MRVAVRARVGREQAGVEPASVVRRATQPVEPVELAAPMLQAEQTPAAPIGEEFSLARTPIEAPRAPALRLIVGGQAAVIAPAPVAAPAPLTSRATTAPTIVPAAEPSPAPAPVTLAPAPVTLASTTSPASTPAATPDPAPAINVAASPLAVAAASEPAAPLPERTAQELLLGRSLGHVAVRSGPATRAALDTLGADGAASGNDVFVRELPAHGSAENQEPARAVLAHEVVHAASTGPAAASPVLATSVEASAESTGAALADAVARFHRPAAAAAPAPAPVDRSGVERAAPGEGAVGLRRSALEHPPTPDAPMVEGDPAAAFTPGLRRPASERGEPDAGGGASDAGAGPSRAGGGEGGAAPAAEAAAPEGELAGSDLTVITATPGVDVPAPRPAPLEGEGVEGKTAAFVAAQPSQKAWAQGTLDATLNEEAQQTATAYNEELPDLAVRLGGEAAAAEVDGSLLLADLSPVAIAPVGAPAPVAEELVPEVPENDEFTGNDGLSSWFNGLFGGSPASNAENIGDAIDSIETIDQSVATSPGPPPPVPLEGATDPALIGAQQAQGLGQAAEGHGAARTAIVEGPGPEVVQPLEMDEPVELAAVEQPALDEHPAVDGIEAFKQAGMPEDVQAAFDAQNAATMEASLAGPAQQVDEAAGTRDADWEAQLASASEQNQALIDAAQGEQNSAVEEQRGRIQQERQSTLERQDEEIALVRDDADGLRDDQQGQIDDRVAADEAEIQRQYREAETAAENEVAAGERQAAAEKAAAEAEAEDESWWDRATGWIGDAIDALVDAVNAIIDVVRDAVNGLLDAVRDAVVGLIELASEFIQAAIGVFGELLKGLVDGLLGEIFPELAAALNEMIDEAVDTAQQAVRSAADGLIAGVDALVDAVKDGLNALLDAFQAAVNLAGALIQAALAGDWLEVLRLLLEAALQLAGIDPEAFYAFVGKVEETFSIIIDDPLGFLGNVFGAVALGFNLFVENIVEHLQTGFFEWLVGPLGELGLTMPASWDVWGILGIVLQVLGLTQDGIRGVVVEELGETAGVVFDYVWRYVDALITGGWQALWEQIQNDLSNLWGMVVDGLKSWLIETIITQATLKLLALLDPSGISQIVQVVLTVWQIYTFLRDNLDRIRGVITAIVDTLSEIAHGQLQSAGEMVEDALASLIPIAISLLANLFGLGGITAKVRDVIEGIRETVRNAIRSLIRRVRGLFSGGGDAADGDSPAEANPDDQADGALSLSFTAAGESHRIYVRSSGTPEVRIASDDQPATVIADTAIAETDNTGVDTTAGQLKSKAHEVEGALQHGQGAAAEAGSGPNPGQLLEQAKQSAEQMLSSVNLQPSRRVEEFATHPPFAPVATNEARFRHPDTEVAYTRASPDVFRRESYQSFFDTHLVEGKRIEMNEGKASYDLRWAKQPENHQFSTVGESSSQYVIVEPWNESVKDTAAAEVDPQLRAAIGTDVLKFLRELAEVGQSGEITRARFNELWNVSPAVHADFVKARFRGADKGHHEWLPTNMINDVIQSASNPTQEINAAELVQWQHEHRTPTWKLVFVPARWQTETTDKGEELVPQGHVGAVYLNDSGQFRGQDAFHNALRAKLDLNKSIQEMARGMREVAQSWIWDGSAPPAGAPPIAGVTFHPGEETYAQREKRQGDLLADVLRDIIEAAQ